MASPCMCQSAFASRSWSSAPGPRANLVTCSSHPSSSYSLPSLSNRGTPASIEGSRHSADAWHTRKISGPSSEASRHPLTVAMGIKAVESFDTDFELNPEAEEVLVFLLSSEEFLKQVATQPGIPEGRKVEFSGNLFQPVPWSEGTRFGMPQEFEKFHHDKENYAIINVPPNFMFKAQVFKPSRLCAIYKILSNDQ